MRIAVNTQAAPISSEKTVLERLQKLSRRPDGKALRRILIENGDEQPRISIETLTPSEAAGIQQLLQDLGFRDRASQREDVAGSENATSTRRTEASSAHDVFEAVYRHVGQ